MFKASRRGLRLICAVVLAASVIPTSALGTITEEAPDWRYDLTLPAANANPFGTADAVVRDNATGEYFALNKAARKVLRLSAAGSVETSWTTYGAGNYLNNAQDIEFDGTYVYVIANNAVYRFTTAGIPSGQHNMSDLQQPTGLAYKSGQLLVADAGLDQIAILNLSDISADVVGVMGASSLNNPLDVAFDVNTSEVWAIDAGTSRLAKFTGAFNGATPTFYSGPGTNDNQLSSPVGLACDISWVYVVDGGQIKRFSQGGPTFAEPYISAGVNLGQVTAPGRIWWDAGASYLVIADAGNNRVQISKPSDGSKGSVGGGAGNSPGEFYEPKRMAKDGSGNVYIADTGNHRIQVFAPDGTPGDVIGGEGASPGKLSSPEGVTVDAEGNVYVSDTGNHRVQKFGPGSTVTTLCAPGVGEGQVMTPTAIAAAPDGSIWVGDKGNYRIQHISATGTVLGVWTGVVQQYDIAVGPQGHIYISQYDSVVQYKPNRDVVKTYDYDLGGPVCIDVDAAANVWVSDPYFQQVQCFSAGRGSLVAKLEASGTAAGEWANLFDIAVDDTWRVWTTDSKLHRVGRYSVADELPPLITLGELNNEPLAPWYRQASATLYMYAHDQRYMTHYNSSLKSVTARWDGGAPELVWSAADEDRTGLDFDAYWWDRVGSYTFSGDGTHTVTMWGTDGAGNSSEPTTAAFGLDTTPPRVTATGLPEVNEYGWVTEPFSVTFSVEDTMSGVSGHSLWGGNRKVDPGAYDFDVDGRYSFSAVASDVAGNATYPDWGICYLDTHEPTITIAVYDNDETGGKTVWLSPEDVQNDGTSNVATMTTLVDGVVEPYPYRVDLTEPGTYTIDVSATDYAGNTGTHEPVEVVVPVEGGGGEDLSVEGFFVAGGRSWVNTTTVTMHSSVAGNPTTMRFTGNSGITWSPWVDYSELATVTVPDVGSDTDEWLIGAEYSDADGPSVSAGDAVGLDRVAPVMLSTNADDGGVWPGTGAELTFIQQNDSFSNAWPMCSVDGTTPVDATFAVMVTGEGTHTVEWWCEDEAGNEELPHHQAEITVGEPAATSLTVTYKPTTVTYPAAVSFSATLTADAAPLSGQTLTLERASAGTGPWSPVKSIASSTGAYAFTDAPPVKTYYRLSFAGGNGYSATSTVTGAVSVKPVLSTPSGKSTAYYRRSYSFYSLVRPKHGAGVTFKFYRYYSGKYRLAKTVYPRYSTYNSTTSKAYSTYAPGYRGKWYVVAVHSDAYHLTYTSGKRYFTVR